MYFYNKISETEIRGETPFTIITRKIKYLEMKLTKEAKDLYSENYGTLKKEITKVQINGRIYCADGLEELTLKCPYYPKLSIYSTQSLLKYQ